MQELIRRIQRAYPQIWFACHFEHRTRSNNPGLTDREAGILEHLDAFPGLLASELARHLGIGKSTLSAQLKRLQQVGLIEKVSADDARERHITLTDGAKKTLIDSSPLDTERVKSLLETLSASERERAVAGIELLAEGARRAATLETTDQKTSRGRK